MKNLLSLIVCMILISFGMMAQPVANFSVDVLEGCAPLEVQFTDESIPAGEIVSWEWIYADTATYTEQNPLIVFDISGVHEICLVVTDMDGLTASHCLNGITTFANPYAGDEVIQDVGCSGGNDGAIDITMHTGLAPFNFLWSNGNMTEDISNLDTGNYFVTITDANSCSSMDYFNVSGGPIDLVGNIAQFLCGGDTAIVDLVVTGGVAPYSYLWSDGSTSPSFSTGAPGAYTVIVTDQNGCTETELFIIDDAGIVVDPGVITDPACAGDLVCIDLNFVTGGCPNYTYSWSDGSTEAVNCNISGGIYSVTVMDCNGCTAESIFSIIEPVPLVVSLDATCEIAGQDDGTVSATVSGGAAPYVYLWSNGGVSPSISGLTAGFYDLTVTDTNGCIAEASIETNDLILSLIDSVNCDGDILFELNAPGAVSYNWTPAVLFDDPTSGSPTATITENTTFNVTVANAAGCEDEESILVELGNIPTEFIVDHPTCGTNTGSIEVTTFECDLNDFGFEWSPNVSSTNLATDLGVGNYTVTVTYNGYQEVHSVELIEEDLEIFIEGEDDYCSGSLISLCAIVPDPGSTYEYSWEGPIVPGNAGACLVLDSIFSTGQFCYTLTVTDDQGCTGSAEHCFEFIHPTINSISPDQSICQGQTVPLEVSPLGDVLDYNYEWTPSLTLDDPNVYNPIATPTAALTSYSVVVTENATGCSIVSGEITITLDEECVWPGDTNQDSIVNNYDLLNIGLAYDSIGPTRPNASLAWMGQPAFEWGGQTVSGVNYKHIDCDGNGLLNADDTLGITMNWGLVHQLVGNDDPLFELIPDYPPSGTAANAPFYVEPDTFIENESYALSIILGDIDNQMEDVYGLAFSLEYDPSIIVPGSVSIGYEGWIGTVSTDLIAIQKNNVAPGTIAVGMTRIDGAPMSGFGEIGKLFITIEDDILAHGGSDAREVNSVNAVFNIINAVAINHLGEEVPIVPLETTSVVSETVATNEINWEEYLQIQPNPANEAFYVMAKNIKIEKLSLYSVQGELMLDRIPEERTTTINTSGLVTGTYLLKVQTELGVKVERILVVR